MLTMALALAVTCWATDLYSYTSSTWVQLSDIAHYDHIRVHAGDWVELRLYCGIATCGQVAYFEGHTRIILPKIAPPHPGLNVFGAFAERDEEGKIYTTGLVRGIAYTVAITVASPKL